MQTIYAPLVIATLFATASASAFALTDADRYGSAAAPQFIGRTIVVDANTRYVNVQHGETVTIRDGANSVNWSFDGIGNSFDLAKILPAAAADGHMVKVYVAPEVLN